jgi:hypothetical protein
LTGSLSWQVTIAHKRAVVQGAAVKYTKLYLANMVEFFALRKTRIRAQRQATAV